MSSNNVIPERLILTIAKLGIAAVSADNAAAAAGESIIDNVLIALDADERTKFRNQWATNPPTVTGGFARKGSPFPLWALTVSGESIQADYLGVGSEALYDSDELRVIGQRGKRRVAGTYTWYIFTENVDTTAHSYRILRRIMNVGIGRMLANGLQELSLQGSDLVPDPQYMPDNLHVRRLTISCEYEEDWTDQDPLWQALSGDPEALGHSVNVARIDSGGGVTTINEDESP